MATKKFVCKVCGYVHEGDTPPETCPVCKAPASQFEEIKKKGFFGDTNNNAYIIFYSVVMVVIVATLLSLASLSLQKRQYENALNEKKQQIVKALGENPETASYSDVIAECELLDAQGQRIEGKGEKEVFDAMKDLKTSIASGVYPIFIARNGCVVVPVYGTGLWDAIWGYVALEPDMNTVKGVVLDHKGETPGLGAEIATEKHQAKYVGKTIYNGEELVGITLKKGGAKPSDPDFAHEVDAITGGTKTSDGVTRMLKDCLGNYKVYFDGVRSAASAQAAESNNELNSENNEQ